MPPLSLNRDQSRRVDRLAIDRYGFTGLVLMENAGRGVADRICHLIESGQFAVLPQSRKVVICCGKGNNAGDGFVIARHLQLRRYDARVLLWADPAQLAGDAAANFRILEKTDVSIEVFAAGHDAGRLQRLLGGAAWIVDAVFGTGARGEPRPPLDAVIDQLNAAAAPILAVDLPSGLDCDTGNPARHTIRAAVTCTFVAPKPGFFAPGAQQHVGQLEVCDIGAPATLIDEVLALSPE
ncbi:MAG: NAD(P)H-hydrate epimerase [Candidatus Nealsonbacteria bacterium]|nr:NAD(P)H-hydrate epimerase [Candidatus Nealsonbacteria bacterium]